MFFIRRYELLNRDCGRSWSLCYWTLFSGPVRPCSGFRRQRFQHLSDQARPDCFRLTSIVTVYDADNRLCCRQKMADNSNPCMRKQCWTRQHTLREPDLVHIVMNQPEHSHLVVVRPVDIALLIASRSYTTAGRLVPSATSAIRADGSHNQTPFLQAGNSGNGHVFQRKVGHHVLVVRRLTPIHT